MIGDAVTALWPVALAILPLALLTAIVCRVTSCRPSTRHVLWLALLLFLAVAPLLPAPSVSPIRGIFADANQADRSVQANAGTAVDRVVASLTVDPSQPLTNQANTNQTATKLGESKLPESKLPESKLPESTQATGSALTRVPTNHTQEVPARAVNSAASPTPPAPLFSNAPRAALVPRDPMAAVAIERPAFTLRSLGPLRTPDSIVATPAPIVAVPVAPMIDAWNAASAGVGHVWTAARDVVAQWTSDWTATGGLAIGAVRDAPPMPTAIWATGILTLTLVVLVRCANFRRLQRRAHAAPPSVCAVVAEAARILDLRRVPETALTADRVSPMVTVLPRPRLLLPAVLWRQLDDAGRLAVVCHELAHLKRRDHWVCWLDMIVGLLYWWHPVVWWVRRRVNEEADLSCDAWVTCLLPGQRRAYATALLETKAFTSGSSPRCAGVPVVALGVSTARTKRFARRLTMIMSHQVTPTRTLLGVALAGSIIGAGWLVAPAFACPPEDDAPRAKRAKVRVVEPECDQERPRKKHRDAVPEADEPGTTFEQFMRQRGRTLSQLEDVVGEEEVRAYVAELESQVERLSDQVTDWASRRLAAVDLSDLEDLRDFSMLQQDMRAYLKSDAVAQLAHTAYRSALGTDAGANDAGPQEMVTRRYEMSDGKLEAITELMSRDDVPILITPGDGYIEVHATMSHQMVFKAFATMLSAEDERKPYRLSQGKLESLTELMVRSDVPVLVSPGDEEITVHGNSLEQLIFGAFVEMIAPDTRDDSIYGVRGESAEPLVIGEPATRAMKYEQRARDHVVKLENLRKKRKEMETQARQLSVHVRELEQTSEKIERQIEEIERAADSIEREADELEGGERIKIIEKLNGLMLEAQQLRNRARLIAAEAEVAEARADKCEEECEAIDDHIADLEEAMKDVRKSERDTEF